MAFRFTKEKNINFERHPKRKTAPYKPRPELGRMIPVNTTATHGILPVRMGPSTLLPDNFRHLPEHLTAARNQGQCGSCWAFGISNMLADRLFLNSISNKQPQLNVPLSVQDMLNCIPSVTPGEQCDTGNNVTKVLDNMHKQGIALIPEYQSPYNQVNGPPLTGKCIPAKDYYVTILPDQAYAVTQEADFYDADTIAENVRSMKTHIYQDGPIVGCMLEVFPDFQHYDGVTIYEPEPGQTSLGGHAIEILGWGKNEEGIEYWICRNSWGTSWPANHLDGMGEGWFYVKMGSNVSRIEELAVAATPTANGLTINGGPTVDTNNDGYPSAYSTDTYADSDPNGTGKGTSGTPTVQPVDPAVPAGAPPQPYNLPPSPRNNEPMISESTRNLIMGVLLVAGAVYLILLLKKKKE